MTTAIGEQAELLRRNVWRYFEGLSDDELHWEPAADMWGVRLKSELRTPLEEGAADGDHWMDTLAVAEADAPLTTVAWRIAHLTLGTWNWNAIIRGVDVPPEPSLRADAAGALDLWRGVLDDFVALASDFTDAELHEPVAAWGGEVRRAFLLSHVTLEIALHSAEVGTMRHLKRALGA